MSQFMVKMCEILCTGRRQAVVAHERVPEPPRGARHALPPLHTHAPRVLQLRRPDGRPRRVAVHEHHDNVHGDVGQHLLEKGLHLPPLHRDDGGGLEAGDEVVGEEGELAVQPVGAGVQRGAVVDEVDLGAQVGGVDAVVLVGQAPALFRAKRPLLLLVRPAARLQAVLHVQLVLHARPRGGGVAT